ncbi:hypothetical protein HanIR_Chr15g0760301 [Helianthus annuus]|nr:hypothetical protein HanIR_Chr15g0760301 [Helianthus annuus]
MSMRSVHILCSSDTVFLRPRVSTLISFSRLLSLFRFQALPRTRTFGFIPNRDSYWILVIFILTGYLGKSIPSTSGRSNNLHILNLLHIRLNMILV